MLEKIKFVTAFVQQVSAALRGFKASVLTSGLNALVFSCETRDHPLMSFGPVHNWPPRWLQVSGNKDNTISAGGEVGILTSVRLSKIYPHTRCYMIMQYEGNSYIGTLLFDDAAFCREVYQVLQTRTGESIREIGITQLPTTERMFVQRHLPT